MKSTGAAVGRMAVLICAAAALVLAVAVALGAQDKDQTKKPAQKEEVTINGDQWKWRGGSDKSIYAITGNIVVKYKDMTLTADRAEYDEKARIVTADGNLKIVDTENEITGSKGTAYLNERRSVIEGGVKLITKPKPAAEPKNPESARAKLTQPTTITCDRMEYLYRKKIAKAEGNLKVTQKNRVLIGNSAVYDVSAELLTLSGGVKATDENGQTFSSPGTVKASLKEGAEWIEAENGRATLKVDMEEETGEGAKKEEPGKGSESSK